MSDDGNFEIVQQYNFIESDTSSFIRTYYSRDESGKINIEGQIVLEYKKRRRSPLIEPQKPKNEIIRFNIYEDTVAYDISKDLQRIENKIKLDIKINSIYQILDNTKNKEKIKDRMEISNDEFYKDVIKGFDKLSEMERFITIDGSKSIEEIHNIIIKEIENKLMLKEG